MKAETDRDGAEKTIPFRLDPWIRRLLIASGIYVLSCPLVWWITGEFLHAFLAWNLVLAVVPLIFSQWVTGGKIRNRWILTGLCFLWLVFLPNALYLMTDLLYLGERDFWIAGGPYETEPIFGISSTGWRWRIFMPEVFSEGCPAHILCIKFVAPRGRNGENLGPFSVLLRS
jgi:hypothetical protein